MSCLHVHLAPLLGCVCVCLFLSPSFPFSLPCLPFSVSLPYSVSLPCIPFPAIPALLRPPAVSFPPWTCVSSQGSWCAVVGHVGSGKSSLIQAVLGQLTNVSGDVTISGSVAYVAHTASIVNAALKVTHLSLFATFLPPVSLSSPLACSPLRPQPCHSLSLTLCLSFSSLPPVRTTSCLGCRMTRPGTPLPSTCAASSPTLPSCLPVANSHTSPSPPLFFPPLCLPSSLPSFLSLLISLPVSPRPFPCRSPPCLLLLHPSLYLWQMT